MASGQDTKRLALAGNFLVASPHAEQRFQRKVVLLIHHDQSGAKGILLNDDLLRSLGKLEQHLNDSNFASPRRATLPVELKVRLVRWAAGELDQEYQRGVWLRTPAAIEQLRHARGTGQLWFDLVRHIGRSVLRDSLHINEFPENAAWN